MPKYEPQTLEDALEEIERLEDDKEGLERQIGHLEDNLSEAEDRIADLEASPDVHAAAELVLAEVVRPVGKLHCMTLADTEASRRALLALSDACGRVP
jgi:predicted nuclease with TOPRIM domain